MAQRVSLFSRTERQPAERSASLFSDETRPVTPKADTFRRVDAAKAALALGAAQARMERLFATA